MENSKLCCLYFTFCTHSLLLRKQQKAIERQKSQKPDEDGWVLVTRHGRNKGALRTQAQRATEKAAKKQKVMFIISIKLFQYLEIRTHFLECISFVKSFEQGYEILNECTMVCLR